ncbi:beta-lactamase-like protein [Mycotypha africana]|uniref:beta-lactamase-like protein n=1 Tax=Mycotypha africana TaxID=64632 RepID=UPI00230146C8|nr:beta-lactamase-like protein [Mycotypha africana]KAI8973234.1 beta-lactamase-like protein [Mycotypha africana]
MEELVIEHGQQFTSSRVEPTHATHFSQLLSSRQNNTNASGWRSIYSMKDISSCIEKIQPVGYNESLSLFSTLHVVAFSSGYSLGSANWLLETSFKKIAFLSDSSLHSTLHPAPMDTSILENADVVVVGGLNETSIADEEQEEGSSSSFDKAKSKLLVQIARTIQAQRNFVIVTPSTGLLFDLIGDINEYFRSIGMEIGGEQHQTPIYVVSPIADQSLKYANICGEWMNAGRHDLLYLPQMPLAHGGLMATGGVVTVNSLEATTTSTTNKLLRKPCIVFTGDSSCPQKGFLSWFLKHWGDSEMNMCAMIGKKKAFSLVHYIPAYCKMSVINIPLDTRLRLQDIPPLCIPHWHHHENNIKYLLLPKIMHSHISESPIETMENKMTQVQYFKPGEVISIDINRNWERVSVSEKLARTIEPTMLPSQDGRVPMSAWASIKGTLNYYNNRLEIQPSLNLEDDESVVLNNQSDYQLNIELSTIMKKFEEVKK